MTEFYKEFEENFLLSLLAHQTPPPRSFMADILMKNLHKYSNLRRSSIYMVLTKKLGVNGSEKSSKTFQTVDLIGTLESFFI